MKTPQNCLNPILIVDDDADDLFILRRALWESKIPNPVAWAGNGEEALEYLRRKGRYAQEPPGPWPAIILLDLNMPRMNGPETLRALKGDPAFKSIPTVILSTSSSAEDISKAYELGANAYLVKPDSYEKLVETVKTLKAFWFETAKVPATREDSFL